MIAFTSSALKLVLLGVFLCFLCCLDARRCVLGIVLIELRLATTFEVSNQLAEKKVVPCKMIES